MRRCSRHSGHGQHPHTSSPAPSHVQQRHLKPRSPRAPPALQPGKHSCPSHAPGTASHTEGTMCIGIQLTQVLCSIIIVT